MATDFAPATPIWIMHLGDARWVRGHVSTFCVGAVVLVCANLLIGGGDLWSLTAIGIWIMLLVVHFLIVLIARLSLVLMADDDEEIVLLPIKDAIVLDPRTEPLPSTWSGVQAPEPGMVNQPEPTSGETVSWTVATDMAQVKRTTPEDPSA